MLLLLMMMLLLVLVLLLLLMLLLLLIVEDPLQKVSKGLPILGLINVLMVHCQLMVRRISDTRPTQAAPHGHSDR